MNYCTACGHPLRAGGHFCPHCGRAIQPPTTAVGPVPPPVVHPGTGRLPAQTLLNGRYRVVRLIAQGGMGAVYEAADTRMGDRRVAVKEMRSAGLSTDAERQEATKRFQSEAGLLAHLEHRCIPHVIDYFQEGDHHYFVMELVDGENLEQRLLAQGPLPEAEVRPLIAELCDVLEYLHGRSPPIIFRDLKPANIMVTRSGQLKLVDFGIARFFKAGVTQDTQYLGTLGYAAPEQHGQSQTDLRTDIYALGVVTHRLLTGHDPAATPFQLPPLTSLCPAVSASLAQFVDRAIEHAAAKRWQSMAEIRACLGLAAPTPRPDLGVVIGGTTPSTGAAASRPTTRLLQMVAGLSTAQVAALVAALVLGGACGVILFGGLIRAYAPFVWDYVPASAAVAPLVHAATRRRWLTAPANVLSTMVGHLAWRVASGEPLLFPAQLIVASAIAGIAMDLALCQLDRRPGWRDGAAWPQDLLWHMIVTGLGTGLMYLLWLGPSAWMVIVALSTVVVGGIGWCAGDLLFQHSRMRTP